MNLLLQILCNIILSFIIIYGIHTIWDYFKEKYSTKKTRDLVNSQITKYKKMIEEIQHEKMSLPTLFENPDEKLSMQNDLTEFINSYQSA